MNLYEAISVKKSVRNYLPDQIDAEELKQFHIYFEKLGNLFGRIDTGMLILDAHKNFRNSLNPFGLKAPYYIIFYSEETPHYLMNTGYLMQQMALFLCTRGYGTCLMKSIPVRKEYRTLDGKMMTGVLAFGKAKGSPIRKLSEAKRMSVDKLCVFREQPRQWIRQLLEAARMAPSAGNRQPWRFVVYDNRIHIYAGRKAASSLNASEELGFGAMFANMLVTGEELWLELDLIRLTEPLRSVYPAEQYILSVVINL